MPKKKNDQDQPEETPVEETDQPEEETPGEEPQEEPAEDSQEEPTDDPQEDPAPEEEPAAAEDNPADSGGDESNTLRQELLQARGELAAYRAGVAPGMVEDAVTLAMAEAAKTGEVTEASVAKAMEAVLKRHPEWKADTSGKSKGGFKLGADRDSGAPRKQNGNATQNVKRWNRFKN